MEVEDTQEEDGYTDEGEMLEGVAEETAEISIPTLTGTTNYQMMRMMGHVGKKTLHILVDSGSTHNFLNSGTTLRMKCSCERFLPIKVTAANGAKLVCESICKSFRWRMQGFEFEADMWLLPLDNYSIVLSVQWLANLGDIQWNFIRISS